MFSTADRMTRFLRFVVAETLEGRGDNLNELLLGMDVYDRDRKFDPRVDSIVRVDAGRLRAKLREFYASEGANSQIAIEVPKGSYKAVFKRLPEKAPVTAQRLQARYPIATKSLGVLPFADVSPQRDHELLGESIVEELIHGLYQIPNFRVVSLSSVLALNAKQIDVREMGRQLGVQSFVEGSVRKAKDRIRVMARLTDVATGFHTWSEVYTFVSRDFFNVQERIACSIAEALSIRLGAQPVRRNQKGSSR
jgi:TolB-like protein